MTKKLQYSSVAGLESPGSPQVRLPLLDAKPFVAANGQVAQWETPIPSCVRPFVQYVCLVVRGGFDADSEYLP